MHTDFDPLLVEWSIIDRQPFTAETGLSQFGGYSIFHGVPYQRGSGLGSVFKSFLRYLLPIGKEIGAAIGRQGLESGNRILSNVLEGKDLKESLVSESKSGLKNLLEKAARGVDSQKGQGFDFKRYKDSENPSVGKMSKPPEKTNTALEKRGPNKRNINKLFSNIGPPNFMPSSTNSKKKKNLKKRLRVDLLGAY